MTSCGEILPRLLEPYEVDTVFGIPGVHNLEFYRGLSSTGLRHITPRHEQGAGFMADGYARVSGKPGVCFVISGPGMTNILTAMGQASGDSIPMLVISSVNRSDQLGMGQGRLHELAGQSAAAATVAEFSHTLLHPDQLPNVLARAFACFHCRRAAPVHIEIPTDIASQTVNFQLPDSSRLPSRPGPDPEAVAEAAELLGKARCPLVILGGGSVAAGVPMKTVIERLGALWINTINAKGVMPSNHPLHAGENLAWAPLRDAVRAADVVLAVGTEFGETDMFPEPQPVQVAGKLIRVDIDPEQLMRGPRADLAIVSDATLALKAITAALCDKPSGDSLSASRRAADVRSKVRGLWRPEMTLYERLLNRLSDCLPDAVIVGDQTQPIYAGNQFFQPSSPRSWFNSSTGYGTLGYALPAAIGAKLAAPERPVVALIGDGGLQFTLPELATAVEAATPIILVVWNNRGYGEIKSCMTEKGIPHVGVDLHTPDFVALAAGFGCEAVRPRGLDELTEALADARDRQVPTVVDLDEEAILVDLGRR